MKNTIILYSVLATALIIQSCNDGSSDSVKKAIESNEQMIDRRTPDSAATAEPAHMIKADADFVVLSASREMMLMQMAALARDNAKSQRVKNLGAELFRDHQQNIQSLKKLAAEKDLMLPEDISNAQKDEIADLEKKKGEDFDRAFINRVVDQHNRDIREFGDQAKNASDADIKAFAANSLPAMYKHLDSANTIQKTMEKKTGVTTMPPVY